MSVHLPECPMPSECHDDGGYGHSMTRDAGSPFVYCWLCDRYCICAALRACEQRVENRFNFYTGPEIYASGYATALDAVWIAIDDLEPVVRGIGMKDDVLAVIDALRDSGNRATEAAQDDDSSGNHDEQSLSGNGDKHLPECGAVWESDYCICPYLRACEQRVAATVSAALTQDGTYGGGYAAGLDAAREAAMSIGFHTHVEGGSHVGTTRTFIDRDEFLAAIKALREENK